MAPSLSSTCQIKLSNGGQAFFPGRSLAGRKAAEAAPELVAQGFVALLDQVYQTGKTFFGTEQPFTPSSAAGQPGQTRYFNFTYQAYREAGAIVGISIFAFDVTEQGLARQEREAQRQQLQAVFEQAPVALFVLHGPTHLTQVVNPAMSEMLGQPVSGLLGKPFAEAIPGIAAQGYPELLAQVWRTGQPVTMQESPAQLARHQPGKVGYFTGVPAHLRRGRLHHRHHVRLRGCHGTGAGPPGRRSQRPPAAPDYRCPAGTHRLPRPQLALPVCG